MPGWADKRGLSTEYRHSFLLMVARECVICSKEQTRSPGSKGRANMVCVTQMQDGQGLGDGEDDLDVGDRLHGFEPLSACVVTVTVRCISLFNI